MAPAQLPTRPLGKNGPQVSAIGLGLMGLSIAYGVVESDEERLKFLDYAHEQGETFWDSSDIYGDNETLIGKWFATRPGKRDDIFLATKFGIKVDPTTYAMSADGSPEYVHSAFNASLSKLGVPSVDLYYVHRIDASTPIEHTVGAMAELVAAGKVKYLGLSECSADTLRRAYAVHPIACVQVEYSPFALDIEKPQVDLLRACRELGVSIVCYSPLGRGIMAGQIRSRDQFEPTDCRQFYPRFSEENFPKNLELMDKVNEIAEKKGITPGQATLAWILAQGVDFIPLPGTKKAKYLKENIDAIHVQLTPEEVTKIREYCENCEPAGERAPGQMNNMDYGDSAPLK
ncbi:aldo/keto reductase-like protein [Morchella snyderi]|nr:aldo/keto reductase-like protein [Morchella snyderi]